MSDRRWTKFYNAKRRNTPYASLSSHGKLYLNGPAYELAGKPLLIVYLYDEQTGDIGFRSAGNGERYSYPVTSPKNRGYLATMRAFATQRGILPSEGTIGFDVSLDGDVVVLTPKRQIEGD